MDRNRRRRHAAATCWTCRLRHKKCDRTLPQCRNCAALGISCHDAASHKGKPAWMDGGEKQREMTDRIKDEIKRNSLTRRERRNAAGNPTQDSTFIVTFQDNFSHRTAASSDTAHLQTPSADSRDSTRRTPSPDSQDSRRRKSKRLQSQDGASSRSSLSRGCHADSMVQFPSLGLAYEQDFIMIYLDYTFPFLFPFYRPPLVGTSRSWLLSFIQQNKAVYHSVLSMSSFFFTIGVSDVFGETRAAPCKGTVWREVMKHADGAFALLQEELARAGSIEDGATSLGTVQMVQTISQLLIFDLFVGSAGWTAHLRPAVSLLDELLRGGFANVLESLAWANEPLPPADAHRRRLWNPAQSGLRFFTAILITVDIISSTALGTAPSLQAYHRAILGDVPTETVADEIDLHTFIGCQNWAMIAIGETATLHSVKQTASQAAFEAEAARILKDLNANIEDIESRQVLSDDSFCRQLFYTSQDQSACTKIWAYSARIYLNTVRHGWQPSLVYVQQDAARVRELLGTVTSIAQFHTLAWPLCVAGCVTESSADRQAWRSLVDGMAQHRLLMQSVCRAMEVVEAVWARSITDETWDFAACFNILGSPTLLF